MIEEQIENQNKIALSYFANRTRDIVEADKGTTLRHFIINMKKTAQNAIKKSSIVQKNDADFKIEDISKVFSYFPIQQILLFLNRKLAFYDLDFVNKFSIYDLQITLYLDCSFCTSKESE